MSLHRRDLLRLGLAAGVGFPLSSWFGALAADAAPHPERKRSCILLWLNGGPATIDLWDLKPGHANGGPFKEINTSAAGVRISEHLPKVAKHFDRLAIVRSMSTKEGDHTRASHLVRTGNTPQGAIQFPSIGALVAKELERSEVDLPGYISVAPPGGAAEALTFTSGFLGPRYAPLTLGADNGAVEDLKVPDLSRPDGVSAVAFAERMKLMDLVDKKFTSTRGGDIVASQRSAAVQAVRMMRPEAAGAFNLNDEPKKLRETYGATVFGQGCLMARRLVERGVPFVEVTLGGWDTHNQNFPSVQALSQTLDSGFAALLADLKQRGLLESTTVVCMGEFGRTPKINGGAGRDHWPAAWSVVLGGGGIKGGQVIGKTSKDGTTVEERQVAVPDVLATVCKALGIDHMKQNNSNVNRPIRIVDRSAKVIEEALA
jgi:uncharacterized protein (DUF1501 family)